MAELHIESNLVGRLLNSFVDLEKAMEGAKLAWSKSTSVPLEVFERLESYGGIITRQRSLAHELDQFVRAGDTAEVLRHVTLINGLSSMIIDDARSILSSFQGKDGDDVEIAAAGPDNFC